MAQRALTVAAVLAVLVLTLPNVAYAKGPKSGTLTGPGIDEPIDLRAEYEAGSLMMGLWLITNHDDTRLPGEPLTEVGPAYTVTWITWGAVEAFVEAFKGTVIQILYPLAPDGPVVHIPPQPAYKDSGATPVGWYRAPSNLPAQLTALGVNLTDETTSEPGPLDVPLVTGVLALMFPLAAVVIGLRRQMHGRRTRAC